MTTARACADHLAELLRREHGSAADFLVALAEFGRERRWEELGYASLFHFLHRRLGISRSSAHFRKTAAELVQRFPEIVEPLRDGRLCITSVVELARVLTEANRAEVLPRFFHCSKQEARALAVEIVPLAAPERTVVTAVVGAVVAGLAPATGAQEEAIGGPAAGTPEAPRGPAGGAPGLALRVQRQAGASASGEPGHGARVLVALGGAAPEPEPGAVQAPGAHDLAVAPLPAETQAPPVPLPADRALGAGGHAPGVLPASGKRDEIVPLTRERARLHVTVSRRFLEKLERAREALSHARPGATAGELLEAGLDLVLAEHARRKGLVAKPRPAAAVKEDTVPAWVSGEVWKRDRGCCQWPLEGGGVCGSRLRVELDHVRAKALGGRATVAGMRLLCRFHNQLAARLVFGEAWMDQFKRGSRRRSATKNASSEPSRSDASSEPSRSAPGSPASPRSPPAHARAREGAPVHAPAAAPASSPDAAPVSVREPAPVSAPEPAPVSVREPAPVSAPEPAPVSVREPAPVSVREPGAAYGLSPARQVTPRPLLVASARPPALPARTPPPPRPRGPPSRSGVAVSASAIPRRRGGGRSRAPAHACFISCTSFESDCFASPKSIAVFSA